MKIKTSKEKRSFKINPNNLKINPNIIKNKQKILKITV